MEKFSPRGIRSDPGGRHKNVIDRPRAKTIDAGESPEWGKAHGDEYGERMVSIFQEIINLGRGKTSTLVVTCKNSYYMEVSEDGTHLTRIKFSIELESIGLIKSKSKLVQNQF